MDCSERDNLSVVDSRERKVETMTAKKSKSKSKKSTARKSGKTGKTTKTTKTKSKLLAASKSNRKKKKTPPELKPKPRQRVLRGRPNDGELVAYQQRGLGARSGGQSGDTQGLAGNPQVDSESVEELLEEGQSFEAEVLSGVENVPDPDQSEIHTREVAEDDVPEEYREKD
jgi:hypothetical protein